MSAEFEFHLKGTNAPEGQLDADHLLAIVSSLKEVATKIARVETGAEPSGRAPQRVHRVGRLMIGLKAGSTTIQVRRAGPGDGALDLDLADEAAFDDSFAALVEAVARDERPHWVSDPLSRAAEALTIALQDSATEVGFDVDGQRRGTFETAAVSRTTWHVAALQDADTVAFVGRLYSANLHSHHMQVQDDVGNRVSLPEVLDDAGAARLLGSFVTVVGSPVHNADGRLTQITGAAIEAAPDPLGGATIPEPVSIEEILASAPGPLPGGGIDMTDEEFEQFWTTLHT